MHEDRRITELNIAGQFRDAYRSGRPEGRVGSRFLQISAGRVGNSRNIFLSAGQFVRLYSYPNFSILLYSSLFHHIGSEQQ